MTLLELQLINMGKWLSKKIDYHTISDRTRYKQINLGEVWQCDLGFNIGEEKNKERPVLIISNNKVNRTGKVVIACITDAIGKINQFNLPQFNTWYLLYTDTTDPTKMFLPSRIIPASTPRYSFLSKDSIVQFEEIRAVSKARLIRRLGVIDPIDSQRLQQKIKNVFDIT
ncbi:MAG: type II toxin-antitoxin system PemK/MazF family toxin [Desulfitobacteriaceae bacterium]